MKKSVIFLLFCLFLVSEVNSQQGYYSKDKTGYQIENNLKWTGSGHGFLNTTEVLIKSNNKTISFGCIYHLKEYRISGVHVNYRIYRKTPLFKHENFNIYWGYEFFYQNSEVGKDYTSIKTDSYNVSFENPPGFISSMEHYIVRGFDYYLTKNIKLSSTAGAGLYIGSLDKMNSPGTPGFHGENMGFTLTGSFGISYSFL